MKSKYILVIGDTLTLLIVTLIGFANSWGDFNFFFAAHVDHLHSASHRMVSARPVVSIIRPHPASPKSRRYLGEVARSDGGGKKSSACHALCWSASSCPARADPQRADPSNLCRCAQCDFSIRNDDLANVVFSFELRGSLTVTLIWIAICWFIPLFIFDHYAVLISNHLSWQIVLGNCIPYNQMSICNPFDLYKRFLITSNKYISFLISVQLIVWLKDTYLRGIACCSSTVSQESNGLVPSVRRCYPVLKAVSTQEGLPEERRNIIGR